MVWDLFAMFTTEKLRVSLLWSPLKDTQTVMCKLKKNIEYAKNN